MLNKKFILYVVLPATLVSLLYVIAAIMYFLSL